MLGGTPGAEKSIKLRILSNDQDGLRHGVAPLRDRIAVLHGAVAARVKKRVSAIRHGAERAAGPALASMPTTIATDLTFAICYRWSVVG